MSRLCRPMEPVEPSILIQFIIILHRKRYDEQQCLHERCHCHHGIKTVQEATVAGYQIAIVFDAGLPLDDGEAQVAHNLDSHLNSRSVCIFLPRLVYIPELSLIPRQVMTSMNKLEFRMDIPAVTREYTPGSCRNSRKPMRLSPPCEMRPDSPALCPEQLCFPNQTRKEPRFA